VFDSTSDPTVTPPRNTSRSKGAIMAMTKGRRQNN
jgi:hypothetical protein